MKVQGNKLMVAGKQYNRSYSDCVGKTLTVPANKQIKQWQLANLSIMPKPVTQDSGYGTRAKIIASCSYNDEPMAYINWGQGTLVSIPDCIKNGGVSRLAKPSTCERQVA